MFRESGDQIKPLTLILPPEREIPIDILIDPTRLEPINSLETNYSSKMARYSPAGMPLQPKTDPKESNLMTDKFLEKLRHDLREFASERDWDQFHSPKNLTMALTAEVGELVEHFQWMTDDESRNLNDAKRIQIAEEIADVMLYLVRLADKTNVDLINACTDKIAANRVRYPAEKVFGSPKKYSEY